MSCFSTFSNAQDGATGTEGTSDFDCGNLPSCVTSLPELRCVNSGDNFISNLTTGTSSVLLPMPSAAQTPQNVVLFGNLIIDNDYTFAPGSNIVVVGDMSINFILNRKLTILQNSKIRGCETMWRGIGVAIGGKIELIGVAIEDAIIGIDMKTQNAAPSVTSSFTMEDCIFNLCSTGVSFGREDGNYQTNTPRPKISIALGGFKNNTFNGNGLLKTNNFGLKFCFAGIHINSVSPLTMIHNIFKNYAQVSGSLDSRAIEIYNSSPKLVGCEFKNIGSGNYSSTIDETNISKCILLNNPPSQIIRIWEGRADNIGFFLYSTRFGSIECLGADISNVVSGIFCNETIIDEAAPISINIGGGTISNYLNSGISFTFAPNQIIKNLKVDNITFTDDESLCSTGLVPYRSAISANAFVPKNVNLDFNNNTIVNTIKSSCVFYDSYGISIQNMSIGTIESNIIIDNNTSPIEPVNGGNKFKGISLNSSTGITLKYNNIEGQSGINTVNGKISTGIEVVDSKEGSYICNNLDNVKTGISFSGSGCDDSEISTNLFRNHVNGLLLTSDAITGVQLAKENRWFGSAGQTEGRYVSPGNDPTFSQFLINNSNPTSVFWANPRIVGNNANDEIWFTLAIGYPPIDDNASLICTTTSGGPTTVDPDIRLSKADHSVVEGLFPAYRGFTATQWDARFRLYDQLARQTALLAPEGSPEKAFYDANSGGATLGTLHSAWKKAVTFGVPTGSTATQMLQLSGEISDLLTQMSTIDETLSDGGISSQSAAGLIAQRDVLMATYETKQSAMQNLTEQLTATEILAANSQLTILNNLAVTDSREQNLKDVVSIILNMQANGTAATENQQITLQNIASQCRYAGGFGVLLARSLYHSYDVNNLLTAVACAAIDEACSTERNSPIFQHFSTVVIASPNPADDFMRITVAGEIGRGTIFMTDLTGRVVYNTPVSGSTTNIPTTKIPDGLYYLVVHSEGDIFQPVKVVITHH